MTGETLRGILEEALPRERVLAMARELKVVQRESVMAIDELVYASVLASRTPAGGRQADVLRMYERGVQNRVVRGTFYSRFNKAYEALMERLLRDNLAAVQRDPVLLPKAIAGVKDWVVIDSEQVKLHEALRGTYPGTGAHAAVKVHKAFSLGRHNLIDFEFSPAKDQDSTHFQVTEAHRGYGFLFDLGYASHQRLRDCETHGAKFVLKLKSGWKARVDAVHVGSVGKLLAGTDIADAVAFGELGCADGVLDVDVTLGSGSRAFKLRLVALETSDRSLCVFLTNLERTRYAAKIVGDLYRLRWEIEKSNKLDKSDHSLDDLDCERLCSAHALLYASLLGACIVNRVVHADHRALAEAPRPLSRGPIHARLLALALAALHQDLAAALRRPESAGWDRLAGSLAHLSYDPNWRSRPSVLDTLFGFTAPPGRPRRQRAISSLPGDDQTGGAN